MPKPNIIIKIETDIDTTTKEFGRHFIEILCSQDARLVPERLSYGEEQCKDPFIDIDDFVSNWWAGIGKLYTDGRQTGEFFAGTFWKRRSSLASRGNVRHGHINKKNYKSPSSFWFESRWRRDVGFDKLFENWVRFSHADIGMLHLFTDPELKKPQNEAEMWFQVGSLSGPKGPQPNIGWAMAYARQYATEVDFAAIRAAGFPVDEVNGTLIVRVTEKLSDVADNFAYFSRRRAELKSLFRPGFFMIDYEPHERPEIE